MKVTLDLAGMRVTFRVPTFKMSVRDDDNEQLISTLEQDALELDMSSAAVKQAMEELVTAHAIPKP